MKDFVETFDCEGVEELRKQLDSLLTSNPGMEKELTDIIRDVLKGARNDLARNAQSGLQMKSDPRQAYRAVRSSVYKRILGGNLNILPRRKAGRPGPELLPPPPRTGRGGNRRKRSQRTGKLQSYWGEDRSFVLRFLNQGTDQRAIKYQEETKKANGGFRRRWVSRPDKYGNRGMITARRWFNGATMAVLENAVAELRDRFEMLIAEKTS